MTYNIDDDPFPYFGKWIFCVFLNHSYFKLKITFNFLRLEFGVESACNHHYNWKGDSKEINDQKPCFFAVIIDNDISDDESNSQEEHKENKEAMDGEPNPPVILWGSLELNEPATDLIYNGDKVDVIGVAFNVL